MISAVNLRWYTLVPEALTWREGGREGDSKRKNPEQREGPLASAVENLTSMLVFGSDFKPYLYSYPGMTMDI